MIETVRQREEDNLFESELVSEEGALPLQVRHACDRLRLLHNRHREDTSCCTLRHQSDVAMGWVLRGTLTAAKLLSELLLQMERQPLRAKHALAAISNEYRID